MELAKGAQRENVVREILADLEGRSPESYENYDSFELCAPGGIRERYLDDGDNKRIVR